MEPFNNAEIFKAILWLLSLVLFIVFLGVYGFRKMRQGFKEITVPEGVMESGKVPGANKNMAFVFNTFQQTLQEINQKKQELIQMHQEAVERVRQIERYNECILESMLSGVVAFDRQGHLTSKNDAASLILGWPKEMDPIGQSYEKILEGSEQFKEILKKVLEENRGVLREEIIFTMKDGGRKWLGVNASPLKGGSGEMIGATLLFTDLTEVKDLQRMVELKNRLAAMGEMSAGIAHEFRNSLGAVLGYARLVERQAGDNEILNESAEGIMAEVKNFDAMLTDFLQFARPAELNRETCSLDELVKESADVLAVEIESRGTRIDIHDDNLPPVEIDRTLMRQALTNLIKNGLQAVGEGGEIRVQAKRIDDRAELWIQDNGCGISQDDQKKIFEPFFTTKREGTGLGLAITQKTILSHHGSLTVKSDPGEGTLVIVSLPINTSAC
jgi:PAS domain S-box-containing protein